MSRLTLMTAAIFLSLTTLVLGVDYAVEGTDTAKGPFTGTISLEDGEGDQVRIRREVRYTSGLIETWEGKGVLDGPELSTQIGLNRGAAGAVEGRKTKPINFELTLTPHDTITTSTRSPSGESIAHGRHVESTPAAEQDDDTDDQESEGNRLQQVGRHLLALTKDALQKKAYEDGIHAHSDLRVSKFAHVGIGAGIRAIPSEDLSEEQRASLASQERPVWLVSEVEGGARIPLRARVDVGTGVLRVGVEPRARIRYEVTDLYSKPEGIDDTSAMIEQLKKARKRSFDLPLDAKEARRMTVGAVRSLEGVASIAVTGSLRVRNDGGSLSDELLMVGASATVSGFYKISADLRFTVERLFGDRVRLRVTRGEGKSRGVSAQILAGILQVDEDEIVDNVMGETEFFGDVAAEFVLKEGLDAIADKVRDRLRIKLTQKSGTKNRDEVDLSFVFDLSDAAAADAYEHAIRGDLRKASEIAESGAGGVVEEFRVLESEDREYARTDLEIGRIFSAGVSREFTRTDMDVVDSTGTTHYDRYRFDRESGYDLLKERRVSHRGVSLDVVRRTDRSGALSSSLRYSFQQRDPATSAYEAERFRRLIESWGLGAVSLPDKSRHFWQSRFGKTRTRVVVEIAGAGLERVQTASEGALFTAYLKAYTTSWGAPPPWATKRGRETFRREAVRGVANSSGLRRRQHRDLKRANWFVADMRSLAQARDAEARGEAVERIARRSYFDMIAISALMDLAPRETVHVEASMGGKHVTLGGEWTGETAGTVAVDDPRR